MKIRPFIYLALLFVLSNCKQTEDPVDKQNLFRLQKELSAAELELSKANQALAAFKNQSNYPLVHIVYFKLKQKQDEDALISEIEKLKAIEVLKNLEIGTFKDLGDQRALSDYDLIMQMEFKDEAAYKIYQQHPIHLGLKKNAGKYLTGPPVTYDFLKE